MSSSGPSVSPWQGHRERSDKCSVTPPGGRIVRDWSRNTPGIATTLEVLAPSGSVPMRSLIYRGVTDLGRMDRPDLGLRTHVGIIVNCDDLEDAKAFLLGVERLLRKIAGAQLVHKDASVDKLWLKRGEFP